MLYPASEREVTAAKETPRGSLSNAVWTKTSLVVEDDSCTPRTKPGKPAKRQLEFWGLAFAAQPTLVHKRDMESALHHADTFWLFQGMSNFMPLVQQFRLSRACLKEREKSLCSPHNLLKLHSKYKNPGALQTKLWDEPEATGTGIKKEQTELPRASKHWNKAPCRLIPADDKAVHLCKENHTSRNDFALLTSFDQEELWNKTTVNKMQCIKDRWHTINPHRKIKFYEEACPGKPSRRCTKMTTVTEYKLPKGTFFLTMKSLIMAIWHYEPQKKSDVRDTSMSSPRTLLTLVVLTLT